MYYNFLTSIKCLIDCLNNKVFSFFCYSFSFNNLDLLIEKQKPQSNSCAPAFSFSLTIGY